MAMKLNKPQAGRTLHITPTSDGAFIMEERERFESKYLARPRWESSRIVIERDELLRLCKFAESLRAVTK
jgi:hypothetical protein